MSDRTIELEYWKARIARALFGRKRPAARARKKGRHRERTVAENGIVGASTEVVAVLAYDGATWLRGAIEQTRHTLQQVMDGKSTSHLWLPSFVTLGIADVALTSPVLARSAKGLTVLGAAGGVGLIAASTVDLARAKTAEERLDATSDFAWGLQGLSYLTMSPAAARAAVGLGLIGATVQVSAGVLRMARGIRQGDAHAVKLGALDLGGGILWAGWDVAGWGNPFVLGSYVVLMIGREAYANKDALSRWLSRPLLLE